MTDIDATSGRPVAATNVHVLYALHLLAPFTLWSLSLLAVVIGAFVRDPVRGTYIETHISWLLRTFCWGILWLAIGTTIFVFSIVGIFLLWALWGVLTLWYLYRVVRGWLRLNDHRPAPE